MKKPHRIGIDDLFVIPTCRLCLIGCVIQENDPRGGVIKRVIEIEGDYAICRASSDGSGRRSKVRLDRLHTARYSLVRPGPQTYLGALK